MPQPRLFKTAKGLAEQHIHPQMGTGGTWLLSSGGVLTGDTFSYSVYSLHWNLEPQLFALEPRSRKSAFMVAER